MNKIVTSLALFVGVVGYAQSTDYTSKVGINNDQPKATLDIKAKTTDGSKLEGILIPRLSRLAAQRMGDAIQKPETSTLIYINDATNGTKATSTIDVDQVGYYYFNDTKWVRLATATVRYTAGVGMQDIGSDNVIKSEFVDKITENGKTGYRVLGTDGAINANNYGNIGTNAIDLSISNTASADAYVAATASAPEQGAYGALGNRSFAAGFESLANAEKSVAIGYKSKALGEDAIALGRYATASGGQSAALGNGATASNQYAFAVGKSVTASGNSSTAIGNEATASGEASFAVGKKVTASGAYSFVAGNTSTASAEGAVAIGENLTASNTNATVLGTYNKVTDTDEIFSVGNGTSSAQKNALVVNGSGTDIKLGIGLGADKGTQAIDANGTARLRNIPAVDNTAVNSLVYADADGVLRKGGSFPKMRVVQFSVVGDLDWISNFDTKIDATKYDVAIMSANLLGVRTAAPDGAVIYPNIYSFKEGGTWRLYADIKNFGTVDRKNGTWFFVVLVAPAGSIDYYRKDTVVEPVGSRKSTDAAPF